MLDYDWKCGKIEVWKLMELYKFWCLNDVLMFELIDMMMVVCYA